MSDYFVSKSFVPTEPETKIPDGPAIIAIRAENARIEQSLPRQESVPAYEASSLTKSSGSVNLLRRLFGNPS